MQPFTQPPQAWKSSSSFQPPQRRHVSPLLFIGVAVSAIIALSAGVLFARAALHAAANPDQNCTLLVPENPLTAQGLATPYQLVATDANQGPCNEANAVQSAFVQGAVLNPATGQIFVYNPLVIDQGTTPAVSPVVPQLPQGAIVGLWFGFNGAVLTLQGTNNSLQAGNCVNGLNGDQFGQFAYCNAPAFFSAANQAIHAGQLVPPPLGIARDKLPCPTVRDFSIVDQDQSDNVTTSYLVTADGKTAQMNAANAATLNNAQTQINGSDNRLLAIAVDGALGCQPWMAPDLANPGHMATALPLNELSAAAHQFPPVALVPNNDPMTLVNNNPNLNKVNAYRVGVDQPVVHNANLSSTTIYCIGLLAIAPQRMLLDTFLTKNQASPDPAAANTLLTFLAQRFITTWGLNGGLNCQALLHLPSPVTVTKDGNGVATSATIDGVIANTPFGCTFSGIPIIGCTGTITIYGQQCTLTPDKILHWVNVSCSPTK